MYSIYNQYNKINLHSGKYRTRSACWICLFPRQQDDLSLKQLSSLSLFGWHLIYHDVIIRHRKVWLPEDQQEKEEEVRSREIWSLLPIILIVLIILIRKYYIAAMQILWWLFVCKYGCTSLRYHRGTPTHNPYLYTVCSFKFQ